MREEEVTAVYLHIILDVTRKSTGVIIKFRFLIAVVVVGHWILAVKALVGQVKQKLPAEHLHHGHAMQYQR